MGNKGIVLGCLGMFTFLFGGIQAKADIVEQQKPWSVRMAESEMVRWPESWQLDFQPALKWDYCHGLELGAMLDVYDRYGDSKFFDYAVAYADTMVNADGTVKKYKLADYSLDRVNSGKILFRIYEQTKDKNIRRRLICSEVSSTVSHVTPTGDSGIRRFIRIRCGWMEYIWVHLIWRNMLSGIMSRILIRR